MQPFGKAAHALLQRRQSKKHERKPGERALQELGARIQAYDPEGHEARQQLRDVDFKAGPYEAVDGADCTVILTEWDEFRALDLARVKDLMARPLVVDLRNVYKPEELKTHGFGYVSVGRAPLAAPPSLRVVESSR